MLPLQILFESMDSDGQRRAEKCERFVARFRRHVERDGPCHLGLAVPGIPHKDRFLVGADRKPVMRSQVT
jgi:hypothetical protein